MEKEIKETGQASMFISLEDGNITVKHGTDKVILLHIENAEKGSWDKIWNVLYEIKETN